MPGKAKTANYGKHKDATRARQAELSAEGRDIGPLPKVKNPRRRAKCENDLLIFCKTYFPKKFKWKFSNNHIEAANMIEACLTDGGCFAEAMPRGDGKTTMAEAAVIWSLLYGHRKYVVLIQATDPLAGKSLKKIQRAFETNQLLLEDFPEVCYPIRRLERIHNRAKGQTLGGEPTRIEWTAEGIVLPTVKGSKASGSVIDVVGITGAIRGRNLDGADGEALRPDFVLIDDAQTRQSAGSKTQTDEREDIIKNDVMGLAGPDVNISCVMLCTVIFPGDLSDRFLDRDKNPEFSGLRTRMLDSMPTNLDKWYEYWEIRKEELKYKRKHTESNAFYRRNQKVMDEGGKSSWEERIKPGSLTSLQSAMNLYLKNPKGFMAEYQNEPEELSLGRGAKVNDVQLIQKRLNGLARCEVPRETQCITCMVDIGGKIHWYAVVAWDRTFGGSVIEYGSWPRQMRSHFAADDARPSLKDLNPEYNEEQLIYAGLKSLDTEVFGKVYLRERSRDECRIDRIMIDCSWKPEVVYQFVRASRFAPLIYPSKGHARTMTAAGINAWKRKPGEKIGHHWRITVSETGKGRMVQFDTDEWKSFIHTRLHCPPGGGGDLKLWGSGNQTHEMFAEHCNAETSEPKRGNRGDEFDKWTRRPHGPDNHLWDCLVGCAVGASIQGVEFSSAAGGTVEPNDQQNRPAGKSGSMKFSEMQRAKLNKL